MKLNPLLFLIHPVTAPVPTTGILILLIQGFNACNAMSILNMHRYPRYSQILKDDFDDTQESSGFSPPAKLKVVEDKAAAAATLEQQQTTESANGKELGTLQWQWKQSLC